MVKPDTVLVKHDWLLGLQSKMGRCGVYRQSNRRSMEALCGLTNMFKSSDGALGLSSMK